VIASPPPLVCLTNHGYQVRDECGNWWPFEMHGASLVDRPGSDDVWCLDLTLGTWTPMQ
jgi:hypothetical protein